MLREWEKLPKYMQTDEVRPYYDSLKKKKFSLALKRGFDVFAASVMLVTFSPVLIAISIMIKNSIFRNSLIFQGLPPIKYQNLMYFPLFLPL